MKADLLTQIDEGNKANDNYLNQGIHLVELLNSSAKFYEYGNIEQKRKIIGLVGSNYFFKSDKLGVKYRQPFDLLAVMKNS